MAQLYRSLSMFLVERILWHVPNVGRLKYVRNLETNEISEIFELEYLDGEEAFTKWTELSNPLMPDEFLQEFITHVSEQIVKFENSRLSTVYIEQALEWMWQELARRVNGLDSSVEKSENSVAHSISRPIDSSV
jgi:hypothetical protein